MPLKSTDVVSLVILPDASIVAPGVATRAVRINVPVSSRRTSNRIVPTPSSILSATS